MTKKFKTEKAFTIVELLVVIVVIGILAAITIVSYSGIRNRAIIASMQSDLSNAATQFKMFHIDNGYYPSTISTDCTATPTNTTNLCLKPSADNSYTTVAYSNPTPQTFILTEVNGSNIYHISEAAVINPGIYVATLAVTDPANWLAVGTQVWARYNLNVGTRVANTTNQTNNGGTNIVEKYCYSNSESNCTTYGGLYQWNEAMNYSIAEGAQGICPAGSHIPTSAEWTTLINHLGIATAGAQLKISGASGLNIPLAGDRYTDTNFSDLSQIGLIWSSFESSGYGIARSIQIGSDVVNENSYSKNIGISVRCIGNQF